MRIPLVTKGFSGSKGIMFLLTVIRARSSALATALPVAFFGRLGGYVPTPEEMLEQIVALKEEN